MTRWAPIAIDADYKIQEAVRRRDQFLAMLSHELRNPLGAIATASALLEADLEQHGAAPQPKLLEVVDRQTRQMGHLLDDLLEVSRVTENKIELRRRVVDLREVVTEAAEAVGPLMAERRLSFEVSTPDAPLYVLGDHETSREAGFDGHLVKPVNTTQLLSLLSAIQTGGTFPDSVRRAELLRREGGLGRHRYDRHDGRTLRSDGHYTDSHRGGPADGAGATASSDGGPQAKRL